MSVGPPRVIDDVKRREICALVSVGCGLETAANYVGCSPSTIRREALRNEKFHDRLRAAEIASQVEPLRAVRAAPRPSRALAGSLPSAAAAKNSPNCNPPVAATGNAPICRPSSETTET